MKTTTQDVGDVIITRRVIDPARSQTITVVFDAVGIDKGCGRREIELEVRRDGTVNIQIDPNMHSSYEDDQSIDFELSDDAGAALAAALTIAFEASA